MIQTLQNIWSSLTTENPDLITVISFPLIFIEAYISMLIFTTLLDITTTKKQKWLYVIALSTFSVVSRFLISNPYNAFVNLAFMLLCVIFIFKTTIPKAILSIIIPFVVEILT